MVKYDADFALYHYWLWLRRSYRPMIAAGLGARWYGAYHVYKRAERPEDLAGLAGIIDDARSAWLRMRRNGTTP